MRPVIADPPIMPILGSLSPPPLSCWCPRSGTPGVIFSANMDLPAGPDDAPLTRHENIPYLSVQEVKAGRAGTEEGQIAG